MIWAASLCAIASPSAPCHIYFPAVCGALRTVTMVLGHAVLFMNIIDADLFVSSDVRGTVALGILICVPSFLFLAGWLASDQYGLSPPSDFTYG